MLGKVLEAICTLPAMKSNSTKVPKVDPTADLLFQGSTRMLAKYSQAVPPVGCIIIDFYSFKTSLTKIQKGVQTSNIRSPTRGLFGKNASSYAFWICHLIFWPIKIALFMPVANWQIVTLHVDHNQQELREASNKSRQRKQNNFIIIKTNTKKWLKARLFQFRFGLGKCCHSLLS